MNHYQNIVKKKPQRTRGAEWYTCQVFENLSGVPFCPLHSFRFAILFLSIDIDRELSKYPHPVEAHLH